MNEKLFFFLKVIKMRENVMHRVYGEIPKFHRKDALNELGFCIVYLAR